MVEATAPMLTSPTKASTHTSCPRHRQVHSFDDHHQAPTQCLESYTPEPRKQLQSIQALGATYDQTGQCLPGITQPARQHAETLLPVQFSSCGKTGSTSHRQSVATDSPAPSMLPIPPLSTNRADSLVGLPTAASFPCGPPTGPNLTSGLHSGCANTVPRGLKRSTTFSAGSNAQFAMPMGSVDVVNGRLGQGTGQAASGLRQRLLALLEHTDRMVSGSSITSGPEPPLAEVEPRSAFAFQAAGTVQAATGTPMGHKAGHGKQAGDSQMDDTCMHEVCVTPFRDPETGTMLFMVQQQDVSARSKLEQRLVALSEGQLAMLDSMFPRHILERISELCAGGESGPNLAAIKDLNSMATHHDCVTIMFTDIVGFTSMSKECKPEQVMEFLNELFSYLDAMLDKHKVHKVETAGDCYIICGGIVDEDEQGFRRVTGKLSASARTRAARRALNFAYDMMQVARRVLMPNNGQPVTLRAGIHSGPVVSGLIGRRVPKFSLFGDTMNTASRMESTSIPGSAWVG
ncbi:nucleotide cyclase [Haematococcus lacustris]